MVTMAETVNVFGKPFKKQTVAIAVGGTAILGFVVYRRKQSAAAAAAASSTDTSGTGTDTTGSGIDLSTTPYDSSSYVSGDGTIVGYDQYGNPIYGTGAGGTGYTPTGTGVGSGPGTYTNNGQWAQAVEQYMGSNGDDAIAAALGKYITGQPMTDAQVTIVQSAIAAFNYPPISGSDGYPPNYKTTQPPPGTPGGGTGGTNVKVPNVLGLRGEVARADITKAGLVPEQTPNSTPKGHSTRVTTQSPTSGKSVKKGSKVSYRVEILSAK